MLETSRSLFLQTPIYRLSLVCPLINESLSLDFCSNNESCVNITETNDVFQKLDHELELGLQLELVLKLENLDFRLSLDLFDPPSAALQTAEQTA